MKASGTTIDGLILIEPKKFGDERGWFAEMWNEKTFESLGIHARFVQDNQSCSSKGILRGLHYQIRNSQDKLVRCVRGRIFDAVVDLRAGSATFGKAFGIELNSDSAAMLWVPKGFAHGFLTLSDTAEVLYKVTDYWSREHERGLRWDCPEVRIPWPTLDIPPSLNPRDAGFPILRDIPSADLPLEAAQ